MLFDGWDGVLRVLAVGVLAYPALVVVLRVSGKRTLSKMNAFDLVVTVALGSTFASILTSRSLPLLDGLVALVLLVALQYVVAWTAVRFPPAEHVIKSAPTLLVRHGVHRDDVMRRQRVSRAEVLAAVRAEGLARVELAGAVVLESDGTLSVIPAGALADRRLEGLEDG